MTPPPRAAPAPFAARDWFLLAAVALMWGSSFLLIKLGVGDLAPATVAWLRLLFGAAALALVPAARTPLRRTQDRSLVAVLGVVWMAPSQRQVGPDRHRRTAARNRLRCMYRSG